MLWVAGVSAECKFLKRRMKAVFDNFLNGLGKVDNLTNCVNQYSSKIGNSCITKNNLRLYLNNIYGRNPKYIFIGEAPGYKGCRITGIPFTSEVTLEKNYGSGLFSEGNGFCVINKGNPSNESTATMIWDYFKTSPHTPFFWNALPFHSHKENNPLSNRRPTGDELSVGKKHLIDLLKIFNNVKCIAIGRVAQAILSSNGIKCIYIRHPANGGKKEFVAGMNKLQ